MSKPRRERRNVVAVEAVGAYALVRVDRGGLEPGIPGQFFMLEAPGRVLPRPMSLCLAPRGELAFLLDPIGEGTKALAALETGDAIHVLGPLGNGFRLDVDRPLLVGEALENGLFNSLEPKQLAGIMAALTADEDRDYGELELNDDMLDALSRFEEIGFQVSSEEWKYGLEPAPELNFSAAGAAVRWAAGAEWSQIVSETRAEEGDLFRMFSRTGEALLQIAGLRRSHPEAANMAAAVAEMVLREPIR